MLDLEDLVWREINRNSGAREIGYRGENGNFYREHREKLFLARAISGRERKKEKGERERGVGRGIETSSTGRERVEAIGNIRRIAGRCAVS